MYRCPQVLFLSRSFADGTSADPGHTGLQLSRRLIGGIYLNFILLYISEYPVVFIAYFHDLLNLGIGL